MATERITNVTEYLRYNFTESERLTMGGELAEAHNKLADIDAEEAVMKAQIKERRMGLEQKVGSLSRELSMGFTMKNVVCTLKYDQPNVGEVEYWRDDSNALVRTRPMTPKERQTELEFDKPVAVNPPAQSIEASAAAVDTFFMEPPPPTEKKSRKKARASEDISATFDQAAAENVSRLIEKDYEAERAEACSPEHDSEFADA